MHNVVSLIGNLGADPELRYLQDGKPVANIRLAVSDYYKDKNGERQQKTYWFTCVAWNKNAEVLSKYTQKGSKIAVIGKLTTREWEDQNGNKRVNTEVIVNDIELLSRMQNGDETKAPQQPKQMRMTPAPPPPTDNVLENEDIPF